MKKIIVLACAAGAVGLLGGCQSEPKATEATLDVAQVQGVGFNDPAPAETTTTADQAPVTPDPVKADTVAASADAMPVDLASIPSATPVPVQESSAPAVPAEDDVAASHADASGEAETPAASGDFDPVSFKVLSGFTYTEPIPSDGEKPEDVEKRRKTDQIPITVKALDGKKAVLEGWMVPMEVNEDGSVKSFVLVKTQPQCCFGDMQAMNEWVDITMTKGKNAPFNVDVPVKAFGELEVGEKIEDGFVLSIYRMKAEKVEVM